MHALNTSLKMKCKKTYNLHSFQSFVAMETRQLAKLGKQSQTSGVFVKRVAVHFSLPGKFAGQEAPGTLLQRSKGTVSQDGFGFS
jgi:hypothetical protein